MLKSLDEMRCQNFGVLLVVVLMLLSCIEEK